MFARLECRQIDRLLWDFAAMALCEPEMEKVEAHISRCRTCARKSEEYASLVGIVKTGRFVRMPESGATWHDLRATLEMERRHVRTVRRVRHYPALALGAAAVGVLLILMVPHKTAIDEQLVNRPFGDPGNEARIGSKVYTPKPGPKSTTGNGEVTPPDTNVVLKSEYSNNPGYASNPVTKKSYAQKTPIRQIPDNRMFEQSREPQPSIQTVSYRPGHDADKPLGSEQQRDYVLNPVRTGDSKNGAHFVMGTIPQSAGGITTASYTKASEEAPVW